MTIRKSATNNGFIIFKDQLSILKTIPNEQLGQAIKLLLDNFDELPVLENTAYELIATNIRRYREQSEVSRDFGMKGGNPTLKGMDNPTHNTTHKLQEKKIQENNIRKENNIKEKKFYVEAGKFFIDDDEKYCEGYTDLAKQLPQSRRDSLCEWFFKNFEYKEIDLSFIRRVLQKAIEGGENAD